MLRYVVQCVGLQHNDPMCKLQAAVGVTVHRREVTVEIGTGQYHGDPAGRVIFAETDTLNNLEKADVVLQADGTYTITISSEGNLTGRDYALAFELEADY